MISPLGSSHTLLYTPVRGYGFLKRTSKKQAQSRALSRVTKACSSPSLLLVLSPTLEAPQPPSPERVNSWPLSGPLCFMHQASRSSLFFFFSRIATWVISEGLVALQTWSHRTKPLGTTDGEPRMQEVARHSALGPLVVPVTSLVLSVYSMLSEAQSWSSGGPKARASLPRRTCSCISNRIPRSCAFLRLVNSLISDHPDP